jgi:hypothetical protein
MNKKQDQEVIRIIDCYIQAVYDARFKRTKLNKAIEGLIIAKQAIKMYSNGMKGIIKEA